jgi:hypothetical protein
MGKPVLQLAEGYVYEEGLILSPVFVPVLKGCNTVPASEAAVKEASVPVAEHLNNIINAGIGKGKIIDCMMKFDIHHDTVESLTCIFVQQL